MMKRKLLTSAGLLICAMGLAVALADYTVRRETAPYISGNLADLPDFQTALVLGTSPKVANGQDNLYFTLRIRAAAELYRQGKVKHFIVSGDNRRHDYNEPDAMAAALQAQGVPSENITADYAGIRTLDSVLRAQSIFGQQRYLIVSQAFHNERAVYLARQHGIAAYGYNAADVAAYAGFKTRIREYFARVKMFIDLWTGKTPKHGGETVKLPEAAEP